MDGNSRIIALEFNSDGTILASANTNLVQLWDVESRKPIGAPIAELGAYSLSFSPDSKVLAFGSCKVLNTGLCDSAEVILWDIALGRPIRQPLVGGQYGLVNSLAFSPKGTILAAAIGGDGVTIGETAVNLWDTASGKRIGQPIKPVPGRLGPEAASIAFSPDGKTMAVGMRWGGVILWDVTTRLPIANSLTNELVSISDVAFSPDGGALAIATSQGVRTVNLDHIFWIEETCQRASRNLTTSEWSQFFPDEDYRATCPQWPAGE